jgi:hypothetical protein
MSATGFNEDFLDMLKALADAGAEYLVVGAHAMAVHGVPRATGDLDVVVRASADNAERVLDALRRFGASVDEHGVRLEDLSTEGFVYQIGLPPRRIDLMTSISGVTFADAWASRVEIEIAELRVAFIGREALIRNKRATGRDKDLVDLRTLEGTKG